MTNDMPAEEKTGFYQPEDEGEDQAADLTPHTDRTPADTITPVKDQESCHVGDTAEATDTADTAPCPDTELVEDPESHHGLEDAPAADNARPGADPATRPPAIRPAALVDLPDDGLPRPDWDRLIEQDLHAMPRLDALYEQVIARAVIRRSQSTRLNFVAAAVHARAGRNPPGLFRNTVEQGKWQRITNADEDVARKMLREHDRPPPSPLHLRLVPKPVPPPALSDDARVVLVVRKWLNAERYGGDPFHAFKRTDEGRSWTRGRWESACQELDARKETSGRGI
jgi:hypothetical protein